MSTNLNLYSLIKLVCTFSRALQEINGISFTQLKLQANIRSSVLLMTFAHTTMSKIAVMKQFESNSFTQKLFKIYCQCAYYHLSSLKSFKRIYDLLIVIKTLRKLNVVKCKFSSLGCGCGFGQKYSSSMKSHY